MSDLPHRPRLAEHAQLRRHLVDGALRLMLLDAHSDEGYELEERDVELLLCADGTRDLGGVMLEASRRGAYRRASEIHALLSRLHGHGLLADGLAARNRPPERDVDRPLEALPGFSLSCDANGSCCTTYASVAFSHDDARRAAIHVPQALAGGRLDQVFLPVSGSSPSGLCAVTMVNGRCAFLADDGRCRVQLAAGAEAKPTGCNIFPALYVDDGHAVRVSVGVECPCVLASVGSAGERGAGGVGLVPEGAVCAGDLPELGRVLQLPEQIAVTPATSAARRELRAWTEWICQRIATLPDPLCAAWQLAGHLESDGLALGTLDEALRHAARPAASDFVMRRMALRARLLSKHESNERWRSPRDRGRRLSAWLLAASEALDDATVERLLAQGSSQREHEAFFLHAVVFGYQLVRDGMALSQSLRDVALRMLLARLLPEVVPDDCRHDAALPYPLTAVESMMRGQGIASYALGLR
jgi:lysine-N-methylase